MSGPLHINTPLTEAEARSLRAGDRVLLSGHVYTARDAAHRRMAEGLERGEPLPFDIRDQVIYYVGPSPARAGAVIGSAGPTTASRMDRFTPALLARGLRGTIGKGERGAEVRRALAEHGGVYLVAVGGAAALIADRIRAVEAVAFADLGTEAITRLLVERFPLVVGCDAHGGDMFEQGRARYRRKT